MRWDDSCHEVEIGCGNGRSVDDCEMGLCEVLEIGYWLRGTWRCGLVHWKERNARLAKAEGVAGVKV